MKNLDFNIVWFHLLNDVLDKGLHVSPRGQRTVELPQHTITVDMRRPVLTTPERKLSYQFMAAEAYWILSGDNTVAGIAPYNKNITEFSDDGKTFFGAYGPPIGDQLDYVLKILIADHGTRQAGLTIWRPNPPTTKDVPCTVAIFFNIREGFLNCHVFMRSSDIWLGIPYDVFTFSMLSHYVCGLLHMCGLHAAPGRLFLTAASSHLYQRNVDDAFERSRMLVRQNQPRTPSYLGKSANELMDTLEQLRSSRPGDALRWWEVQTDET